MMRAINDINARPGDRRGIALMMVMVLSTIALAVMAALLYIITIGTEISGSTKRFETARQAAGGGKEAVLQWIGYRDLPTLGSITVTQSISANCMASKFLDGTEDWGTNCPSASAASSTIDYKDADSYDMRFTLGDYYIYAKIVNTIEGNSSPSSATGKQLITGGVVSGSSSSGEIPVMPVSYLYTIVVEARNKTAVDLATGMIPYETDKLLERAKIEILYQY